jgi:hypothetical protein
MKEDPFKSFYEKLEKRPKEISDKIKTIIAEEFLERKEFQETERIENNQIETKELDTKLEFKALQNIGGVDTDIVASIVGKKESIDLIKEDERGVGSKNIEPRAGLLKWNLRIKERFVSEIKGKILNE